MDRCIGDRIENIVCQVYATHQDVIYIAWDAIEIALGKYSSYKTVSDLYGQFSSLCQWLRINLDLKIKNPSYSLLFGKKFTNPSLLGSLLPIEWLKQIDSENYWNEGRGQYILRDLQRQRFDIRTHSTHNTVPTKHFCCCYPFTTKIPLLTHPDSDPAGTEQGFSAV